MSPRSRMLQPAQERVSGIAGTGRGRLKAPLARPRLANGGAEPAERTADRAMARILSSPRASGSITNLPGTTWHTRQGQGRELHELEAASLERALTSPGQPIDTAVRSRFEPRFGHSFADVRVHTNGEAQSSAKAMDAQAYTIGRHIVFDAGRYAPSTARGSALIAHELAHVVQQRGDAGLIQRKLNIDEFEGGEFDTPTLLNYLNKIKKNNKIEDKMDSDDKAREIVKQWRKGGDDFILEPEIKVLLIKEMQSGFTGNDDERAILSLLFNSARPDVETIFGPDGLDPGDLDSDFHGPEEDELRAFYDREFAGSRKAALKGSRSMVAEKMGSLKSPYTYADLRAYIDRRVERINRTVRDRPVEYRSWYANELARQDGPEIYEELQKLTPAEREKAAADIASDRARKASQADVLDEDIAKAKEKIVQERLGRRQVVLRAEVLMLDLSMQPVFRDVALGAPKDKAEFQKTTTPLSADQKKKARAAITPVTQAEAKAEATGAPPPPEPTFKDKIPGDPKSYGQKIAERIPKMIQEAHDHYAKNRTEKEHSDPKLTHQLSEMDDIANRSKAEVDLVFGAFYKAKNFKAFQADKRNAKGKVIKKGNFHDAWQDEEDKRKADPGYERRSAKFWLFYLIQNDSAQEGTVTVETINSAHDASPSFGDDSKALNKEAKKIREVADPFVKSESKRLFEIGRAWDAFVIGHDISVQLFKNPDALEDRRFLWETFHTLIHEYLHSLAHPEYDKYAEKLGGEHSTEGSTLIEGVDSLLTEITWTSAKARAPTDEVRKSVEPEAFNAGEPFDPTLLPPEPTARADTYPNAVKLVNVVGIRNLYAAYFQGKVKLIGK